MAFLLVLRQASRLNRADRLEGNTHLQKGAVVKVVSDLSKIGAAWKVGGGPNHDLAARARLVNVEGTTVDQLTSYLESEYSDATDRTTFGLQTDDPDVLLRKRRRRIDIDALETWLAGRIGRSLGIGEVLTIPVGFDSQLTSRTIVAPKTRWTKEEYDASRVRRHTEILS